MSNRINIIHGNFFKEYKNHILPAEVDCFFSDIPYNLFKNKSLTGVNDPDIDLNDLETVLDYMMTKNGVVVLWCNLDLLIKLKQTFSKFEFKYNYVVNKSLSVPTGKYRPIPTVEYIAIFYRTKTKISKTIFNGYKSCKKGLPYQKKNYPEHRHQKTRKKTKNKVDINKNGERWMRQDQYMKARPNLSKNEIEKGGGHPFQKELKLTRILSKVYTNKNSLVVDGFMGSGTTAEACLKEGRHFIGFEIDKKWVDVSRKRINKETSQVEIFN